MIDGTGASVVPLMVESAVQPRPPEQRGAEGLVAGNPATFAVVRGTVGIDRIRRMLVVDPPDLIAVVVAGRVEVLHGKPTRPPGVDDDAARRAWVATWIDESRDMEQHLLSDGRYSETRQGRRDAYSGRYWVHGDRITYLDDTGFWAFGQLQAGVLHHAGYVLRRPAARDDRATRG